MHRLIICIVIVLAVNTGLRAQSTEDFLEKVKLNHPGLIAAKQLLSSGEAESRTGITPDDPVISAGYFPGNDAAGENKITWGVSQSFDFPSRYARLKSLKRTNLELAKMEYQLSRFQLLSEARASAIKLISLNKSIKVIEGRLAHLENMQNAYSLMLENGETTTIDYNKIVIKKVALHAGLNSLISEADLLSAQLDFMSGNNSALLDNADFPSFKTPDIASLKDELRTSHPGFLLPGLNKETAGNVLALSKAESLPGFQLGYSSEIVGNTRFTGPSMGLSVPLWKNRGKIKTAMEGSDYQAKKAESDLLMLESYYNSLYTNFIATDKNLKLVESTINDSDNAELLKKVLEAGEISLTDYLLELESVYQLEDLGLELNERKYSLLSLLFELDFKE